MNETYSKKLARISKLPLSNQQIVLAAFLASLFKKHGIILTVVGGAAVQFYTQADYVTHDLDAILYRDTKAAIEEVMFNLGFKRTSMYRHFEHPLFKFVVEFPPSPIEIGARVIQNVSEIETEEGKVRVTKIEDVIMDRLIAALVWKDKASLDQAKLIWIKNKRYIDLDYLKDFAKSEGCNMLLKKVIHEKK